MSDILCMKSFTYKEQDKYVSPSCTESNKEVRKYILTILSITTERGRVQQEHKGRIQIRVRYWGGKHHRENGSCIES